MSNDINNDSPDDLPDLIPIEPDLPPAPPIFTNLFNQFIQQIPYTMGIHPGRHYYGDIPPLSTISNHIMPTHIIHNEPAATPTPLLNVPILPRNTTGSLSSIIEQSFHEKPQYKHILSEEGAKQITYTTYAKEKGQNAICAITREEFAEGDDIAILPCRHVFSRAAINQWLQTKKAECPICRFKLESKEVKEETENIEGPQTIIIPRFRNMQQMIFNLINNSIDTEEDDAIQRAIIASLQDN